MQTRNIYAHILSHTYPPAHSLTQSYNHYTLTCFKNSLKEGEEVDELSLGDAEREDGLHLLCSALLFSLGAWNEGLSRTKLEDVPQVVLQSLATLLYHLTTLHRASDGARILRLVMTN